MLRLYGGVYYAPHIFPLPPVSQPQRLVYQCLVRGG